ncbi:hypothetical protein BH09SUM1_BH09SUM1_10200 [soil metagenome]
MSKSFARGMRAFTLIELLIVVAIIAILAAIAVPNVLEAQTRAKVARAKADMRSLATALESYAVDHNHYPWPGDDAGVTLPSSGGVEFFETKLPTTITTPIAYITSRPSEPFKNKNETEEKPQYHYASREYLFKTNAGDVTELDDLADEMIHQKGTVRYYLLSHGPDLDHDSPDLTENPLGPALYDPTNGTVSSGDIFYWGSGIGFKN